MRRLRRRGYGNGAITASSLRLPIDTIRDGLSTPDIIRAFDQVRLGFALVRIGRQIVEHAVRAIEETSHPFHHIPHVRKVYQTVGQFNENSVLVNGIAK